jgi:hypothetical protein
MKRCTRLLMLVNLNKHASIHSRIRGMTYQRYRRRPRMIWIEIAHAVGQVPRVRPDREGWNRPRVCHEAPGQATIIGSGFFLASKSKRRHPGSVKERQHSDWPRGRSAMSNSTSRSAVGVVAFLLLSGSTLCAQDRTRYPSGTTTSRSATSHYGVPYWQAAANDARNGRSTRDDGVAPRLYERREQPAPPPAPAVRHNYYPNMGTGQYANYRVPPHHNCTPSRGQLAGRR